MNILPLVIILTCFFIFLFALYALSNDDFVLLRKHVTTTNIFDTAFLILFFSIFFARLFYVLFHFSPGFVNPVVFFLFPYFPGLSVVGGIIGGVVALYLSASLRAFPKDRIFDVFSLSFLACLPIGSLFSSLAGKKLPHMFLLNFVMFLVVLFFFIFLLRLFHKGRLKDGSISILVFLVTSLILLAGSFFQERAHLIFLFSGDQILLFALFVSSTALFIRQENLFLKKI